LKITKISFIDFKHFNDQEIYFKDGINALIGENNAGKTSILHAIAALFNISFGGEIRLDFPSKLKEPSFTTRIEIYISLTRAEWKNLFGLKQIYVNINDRLSDDVWDKIISCIVENEFSLPLRLEIDVISDENRNVRRGGITQQEIEIYQKINSHIVPAVVGSTEVKDRILENKIITNFNSIIMRCINNPNELPFKPLIIYPYLSEFRRNEPYISYSQLQNKVRGDYKNINVRSQLFHLKRVDPNAFQEFKEKMESNFKGIENVDVILEHYIGNFELILDSFRRDITLYGGGTQTFAQLFSIISLEEVSIVLIDEPDAHLHANLIKNFVRYLKELAKSKQIIITTHLPNIIDNLSPTSIISLELINGKSIVSRPKDETELHANMAQMGLLPSNYKRDLLKRADVILFVEGKKDINLLSDFIDRIKNKSEELVKIPKIEYLEIGKRHLADLNKMKKGLLQYLEGKKIVYIRDRDEDSPETIRQIKNFDGLIAHIWEYRQIESYLLDTNILVKIIIDKKKLNDPNFKEISDKVKEIIENECNIQHGKLFRDYIFNRIREDMPDRERDIYLPPTLSINETAQIIKSDIIAKGVERYFSKISDERTSEWVREYKQKWETNAKFMINAKYILTRIRRDFNVSFEDKDIISYLDSIPEEIQMVIKNKIFDQN